MRVKNRKDGSLVVELNCIQKHMFVEILENVQNMINSCAYQGVFDVNVIEGLCSEILEGVSHE